MKLIRHLLAALILLAWLVAGAHVALEHGGKEVGSHHADELHGTHHHDEPAPGEDDHHHDLGAVTPGQLAKAPQQQRLAPQWAPIFDRLLADLAVLLCGNDRQHTHSTAGDSPPDERASGWLLAVQTARPVRGPSLAA